MASTYVIGVRELCEFTAKTGSLDHRFTPSPTAAQGIEGHRLVAQRRPPDYEVEVPLSGEYGELRIRGRADGFDPQRGELEEIKTFRGRLESIPPNMRLLHWAQACVYGSLLCESRSLPELTVTVVYFDVVSQTEHPQTQRFSAQELRQFMQAQAERFLQWARAEMHHRAERDAALKNLGFPLLPFRPGQRELAAAVFQACRDGGILRAQAPTGIGKTLATIFPALRAMPERGVDRVFFLTAKTPGRAVALQALGSLRSGDGHPLRVLELVAKDKSCEHPDKACHGESCDLARGFYDRLPAAREAAVRAPWLDQAGLREVALAHALCPYYLQQEMARWVDVVVGDLNHYFDRHALLHGLSQQRDWRVSVLADEAHNLVPRSRAMYSADFGQAECGAVRAHLPTHLRRRLDDLLEAWQALIDALPQDTRWQILPAIPEDWLKALARLNSGIGEHLQDHPAQAIGPMLNFYFRSLSFAGLAEALDAHSLCELSVDEARRATLNLRNVVPAPFLAERLRALDSLVMFSATLHPRDFDQQLLGLPEQARDVEVPSPFDPRHLQVHVHPVSTRWTQREATLDSLVQAMATHYARRPGNYLAFFSSFDYLERAMSRLQRLHPQLPCWAQTPGMAESERQAFLDRLEPQGSGIAFAVLGGAFSEGVDLPGTRLIGAFIATLGYPQVDDTTQAVRDRLEQLFPGRGFEYTFVVPGLQKVVQAAGRVIRSPDDKGSLVLLDERYRSPQIRRRLPKAWFESEAELGVPPPLPAGTNLPEI